MVVGEQDNGRVMEIVDCAGQSAGKGGQFGKEKNRRTETEKGKNEEKIIQEDTTNNVLR